MQLVVWEEMTVLLQVELPPGYDLRFLIEMFEDEALVGILQEDEERTYIDKTEYRFL